MLSIHWIQDVNYYLHQATADYYFRPGEPPGKWWGRGAKSLGLTGFVTAEQLKALCKGFSPDGKTLIQNAGASDHQQAWDLTFSAPKSVSVLWSQAPRAIRMKIRRIHHKAIKSALNYLSESALLTRRGKGGVVREAARPIVAIFEHGSNRELEPQLHSHCVLVNVAARADGTFGTILSDPFYRHKLTAGALYRAELACLLRRELGLRIERQDKAFAVTGIPRKLVDHYSTRRKQIEAKLGSKGRRSARAAAAAALDTRKTKLSSPPPRGELFRRWQETNARFGFTESMVERLLGQVTKNPLPPLQARIAQVVTELLETESYFSEQQLIRGVAINAVAEGVSAADVIDQVRAYLTSDPETLVLGAHYDETVFTTREMWRLEEEFFATIAQGRRDVAHIVAPSVVNRIVNQQLPLDPSMTEDELARNREQSRAVVAITTGHGDVQVMEGMAGTGKTFTLKIARQAWEKAGYSVTGMALSAVAAANLQEGSGIESDTLAMRLLQLDGRSDFAHHHKRQLKRLLKGKRTYAYNGRRFRLTRKTIVVLDEAGMVGTRQLVRLVKHVRKAGAKLVMVGDRRQLQPVEAGGPFNPIAKTLRVANLEHVVRQKLERDDLSPNWHREAGKLIAAGAADKAMELFAERGRLSVLPERSRAMHSIVRDWSVQGAANPNDHVVLAGTRAEVAELNEMCQMARRNAGILAADHCLVDDLKVFVGDIVLFTKNSRLYQVNNGDRGEILGFNHLKKTMAVRLQAADKTVYIPYRSYKDLQLGYAMTTHKAQGATVPSVYVLLGGPMQDRHLTYVQATRACESTRLYVDKCNAGPKLKHLLNHIKKARPKKLAHDVAGTSGPGTRSTTGTFAQSASGASEKSSKSTRTRARGAKNPRQRSTATSKDSSARVVRANEPAQKAKENRTGVTKPRNQGSKDEADKGKHCTGSGLKSKTTVANHEAETAAKFAPFTSAPANQSRDISKPKLPRAANANGPPTAASTTSQAQRDGHSENLASSVPTQTARAGTPAPKTDPQHQKPVPTNAGVLKSKQALNPPRRDILDLSHVKVVTTTDATFLRTTVERYGSLPGGIVVQGIANSDVPLKTLAIAPDRPGCLIINRGIHFDTGLTPDELALVWHAVLESGQAMKDFGALTQQQAIGIDNDTEVAVTMFEADNYLGGIVYGYDSQYKLGSPSCAQHRNPFVEETAKIHVSDVIERLFFNYMNEVAPQFFLTVTDVRLSQTSADTLAVSSTQVNAAIGIVTWNGTLVTESLLSVEKYFPFVYDAFQLFSRHLGDHARTRPDVARCIAYAELASLLRAAKLAKASLMGREYVGNLVARRRHLAQPQFDFTVRSPEFVELARGAAHRLLYTKSTALKDLMALTVALHYAYRAGDFDAFMKSKREALACIERLESSTINSEFRNLIRALPHLKQKIQNTCHDTLIDACIGAARNSACAREQRKNYLTRAIALCGSPAMLKQNPTNASRLSDAKNSLKDLSG